MSRERHEPRKASRRNSLEARALALFTRALSQPTEDRQKWLKQQCGNDLALLTQALKLERAERDSQHFLDAGPVGPKVPDRRGERLGAFELTSLLAFGGMSVVYRGQRADGAYKQDVAIKLIQTEFVDESGVARFTAERQILAALEHPGIARLIDGGAAEDGTPYVVMEYIDGQAITHYCDEQALDLTARLRLFQEVCSALNAAHERGVVHRDIKAGNILVTAGGRPKVIDFGIAKVLRPEFIADTLPATRTQMQLLTPEYASPEQVRGEAVTIASDVYSLGILLYELVTGARPYHVAGLLPTDIERTVCHSVPMNPSTSVNKRPGGLPGGLDREHQLSRKLRGDLDRIVMTALRKDPNERYAGAKSLSEDLERYLTGQPVKARGSSSVYRARKFAARHRVGVATTAATLVVLSAALVTVSLQAREAQRARIAAEQQAARAESAKEFLVAMIQRTDPFANAESATLVGALKQAIPNIDQRFAGAPALEAEIRYEIGYALQNLGEIAMAREQLDAALALRTRHGDALDRAEVLDGLALVDWWESDFEQAGRRFEQALNLLRGQRSARAGTLRATVLTNWSALMIDAGDYPRSKSLALQALDIMGSTQADITLETQAATWSNLATAEQSLKNNEAALTAFEKSMDLQRRATGEMHPGFAIVLNNLALLYYAMERYQDAAKALSRSVEIRRQTLGADHPQTATALFNLSYVQTRLGDLKGAEASALEALEIAQNGYPANHPRIGKAHQALAVLYLKTERPEKARQHAMASREIYAASEGVDPAWVASIETLLNDIDAIP